MKLGVIAFFALMLAACAMQQSGPADNEPGVRIDGTTPATTKATLTKMYNQHDVSDQCELHHALLRLDNAERTGMYKTSNGEAPPPLRMVINGMTYEQIIELSYKYPDIQTGCASNFESF